MSCLLKFKWVKLQRQQIPVMNSIMSYYLRLVARTAVKPGTVRYCQYLNDVEPGTWSGGIVGLKSILGLKNADKALDTLRVLS